MQGTVPTEAHTYCTVDELPFEHYDPSTLVLAAQHEGNLLTAWHELGRDIGIGGL